MNKPYYTVSIVFVFLFASIFVWFFSETQNNQVLSQSTQTNSILPNTSYTVTFAAVGDISCSTHQRRVATKHRCKDAKVSQLLQKYQLDYFLPLGDLQYNQATTKEINENYLVNWSQYLPITKPVLGNHEYYDFQAKGFFNQFKFVPKTGYYSFSHKDLHFIALNTNCDFVSCGATSSQIRWFKNELVQYGHKCLIVYGHHPRFSSGPHGQTLYIDTYWKLMQKYGVEIYLSGHDHHYERFDTTPVQYVVGTGGKSIRKINKVTKNSKFYWLDHGVLILNYDQGVVTTSFHDIQGRVVDQHKINC